jgi:hypothetical protein
LEIGMNVWDDRMTIIYSSWAVPTSICLISVSEVKYYTGGCSQKILAGAPFWFFEYLKFRDNISFLHQRDCQRWTQPVKTKCQSHGLQWLTFSWCIVVILLVYNWSVIRHQLILRVIPLMLKTWIPLEWPIYRDKSLKSVGWKQGRTWFNTLLWLRLCYILYFRPFIMNISYYIMITNHD